MKYNPMLDNVHIHQEKKKESLFVFGCAEYQDLKLLLNNGLSQSIEYYMEKHDVPK